MTDWSRKSRLAVARPWSTADSRDGPGVVVAGMETHVCVLNTVLDLPMRIQVFVPVDAVQSRYGVDHETRFAEWSGLGPF